MNAIDVQVIRNPDPDRTSLGSYFVPSRRTAFSLRFGTIDECAAQQDHVVGNLIADHPMTALGNLPCNGCRACCLHDMIPLMPEHGDLIWTYEHEVIATAAGPMAVLQCGETASASISVETAAPYTTGPRRSVGHSIAGICFSARPAPSALRWPNPAWSRMRFSLPGASGSKRWICRDDGRQHGYR